MSDGCDMQTMFGTTAEHKLVDISFYNTQLDLWHPSNTIVF